MTNDTTADAEHPGTQFIDPDAFRAVPDDSSVEAFAKAIASLDIDTALIQRAHLGVLSFESSSSIFSRAIDVSRKIAALPVEELSDEAPYEGLRNQLHDLHNSLVAVVTFDPTVGGDPGTQRNNLDQRVRSAVTAVLNAFNNIGTYLLLLSGELDGEPTDRINEVLADIRAKSDQQAASAERSLDEVGARLQAAIAGAEESATRAADAASAAQAAAGLTGVTEYSKVFEDEAALHAINASRWLKAGLGGLVVLILATFGLVFIPIGDEISDPTTIQLILVKGLFVTFGGYAVLLAFRMFRAERHLTVVNRHRDRALRTFETFAAASSDPSVKDAVLLESTRAIFSLSNTGVLDGADSSPPPPTLMEIIRRSGSGDLPT